MDHWQFNRLMQSIDELTIVFADICEELIRLRKIVEPEATTAFSAEEAVTDISEEQRKIE